ncbi:MAG: hypothetical protein D6741_17280, partial [Planctomycetota bacterium]
DTDASIFPNAGELPGDGIDNDCDGADLAVTDTTGIFVAPVAFGGDDANPGTMAAPVSTFARALSLATAQGKVIFASVGTWNEAVTLTTSVYGGFVPLFGTWIPTNGPGTVIAPALGISGGETALLVPAGVTIEVAGVTARGVTHNGWASAIRVFGDVRVRDSVFIGGHAVGGGEQNTIRVDGGTTYLQNVRADAGVADGNFAQALRLSGADVTAIVNNSMFSGARAASLHVRTVLVDFGSHLTLIDSRVEPGERAQSAGIGMLVNLGSAAFVTASSVRGPDAGAASVDGAWGIQVSAGSRVAVMDSNVESGRAPGNTYGLENFGTATVIRSTVIGGPSAAQYANGIINQSAATATIVGSVVR